MVKTPWLVIELSEDGSIAYSEYINTNSPKTYCGICDKIVSLKLAWMAAELDLPEVFCDECIQKELYDEED